jgi:CBS domain-containing protein
MDELSSRFLDDFTAIEKHLRTLLNAERHKTFNELVEKAARVDKGVRRLRGQLKDFGELRNFVVHEYRRDQPTASPSAHAVERLQAIRDELLSPPKLIDLFRPPVETCALTDPVGAAARKMHDGSFSQLPVYEGDRLFGLLTAETVARWLAGGLGLLEEEAVEIVMRHEEGTHTHVVMGRIATVEDALTAFDEYLRSRGIARCHHLDSQWQGYRTTPGDRHRLGHAKAPGGGAGVNGLGVSDRPMKRPILADDGFAGRGEFGDGRPGSPVM